MLWSCGSARVSAMWLLKSERRGQKSQTAPLPGVRTEGSSVGRGSRIRTCGPLLPKQVLYQAEQCPEPQLLGGVVTALQRSASGQEGNNRTTWSLEPGIVPDCSSRRTPKYRSSPICRLRSELGV